MIAREIQKRWSKLPSEIEVAVASNLPDKLLGVRDGFVRFFDESLKQPREVAIVPCPGAEHEELPLTDDDTLSLARQRAQDLRAAHEANDPTFVVGTEAGILTVRADRQERHFVRCWTVVLGPGAEAWGSSGSLQLPERLIAGLDTADLPIVIPGTRRHGGTLSTVSGGLETRRSATALSAFHALASLLYGAIEGGPGHGRR